MPNNEPSQEEVIETINNASELRDKIIEYINTAQKIDDDFIEQHDEDAQEIYLDILPFREELLRTADLPNILDNSIKILNQILDDGIVIGNSKEKYEEALESIEDARSTFEDCTDIPESKEEY